MDRPVVSVNFLHGFGQCNLRKPRRQEREVGCKRWKAFKHPTHSADRRNRIAHQAQRSQILTSSPLSAVFLYSSYSLLRRCHTARELSRVLQNKTSKSVEKVRGYNILCAFTICSRPRDYSRRPNRMETGIWCLPGLIYSSPPLKADT